MPKTFVITASVYVDGVDTPEEARDYVEETVNVSETEMSPTKLQIRLPDPDSGYKWEESGA